MKTVIDARNITVMLSGKEVLKKISFSVRQGELVGIIGPKGAGKTTLLRALLGLVPLANGTLKVMGCSYPNLKAARAGIGYMPQRQSFARNIPLLVSDVVATGLLSHKTLFKRLDKAESKIIESLDAVSMKTYLKRSFQDLSGGEQQRVLLARALVRQPGLLLLDEPNSGLDFNAQRQFIEMLDKLKSKMNLAIAYVSHDLVSIAASSDSLLCINRTMHIHGDPAEVIHSPHFECVYRCQFDLLNSILHERECLNE